MSKKLFCKITNSYVILDTDFKPETFWGNLDSLLSKIKGDGRKTLIKNALSKNETIPESVFESDLPKELKDYLMGIDPRYSGGEYLPDFIDNEVEILRIVLVQSVLNDVISLRTKFDGNNYFFNCYGEYEDEKFIVHPKKSSEIPTTNDLINMILSLEVEIDGKIEPYLYWIFQFWYFETQDTIAGDIFIVKSDYYEGINFYFQTLQDRFYTISNNDRYKKLSKKEMYKVAINDFKFV